jgi:hypothetical protein
MTAPRKLARLVAATALATLALAGSGSFAATQMFKCIIGGRTVYQQQACPADAEAPKAATTTAASSPPASAAASSAAPRKPKPGVTPASTVPATPR